jgi:hypothetical protein
MEEPLVSSECSGFSELLVKEYESLRGEIADSITETRLVERHALFAAAATWVWILSQSSVRPWMALGRWLPLTIVAFGALRAAALYAGILQIGEYIRAIEDDFAKCGPPHLFQWEHFVRKTHRRYVGASSAAFWLFLLVINFLVGQQFQGAWLVGHH